MSRTVCVSAQVNEDHNRPARDRTRPSVKQTSPSALCLLTSVPRSPEVLLERIHAQAAQKGPDARRRVRRGARRTYVYVAAPRERANAADGPFSAA